MATAFERRHLEEAVAVLVHEARRADYEEGSGESRVAVAALADLFALDAKQAAALLAHGREKAQHLLHVPNTDAMMARNRARPSGA